MLGQVACDSNLGGDRIDGETRAGLRACVLPVGGVRISFEWPVYYSEHSVVCMWWVCDCNRALPLVDATGKSRGLQGVARGARQACCVVSFGVWEPLLAQRR